MGNCFGSPSGVDKEARSKHQDIERQLKADKAELERSVKLLLLGSGESGKSTILKQFKLIHGVPYTDSERMSFRPAILGNLLAGGKTLVDAMERLNIPYETQEAQRGIDAIRAAPNAYGEGEDVPKGVSDAMQALWADPGVQACFKRSAEFQLIDSCQ
ncbi:guanine nucleotide-binding protein subunit alpha [Borealophlyctis nickersoniae]|nr:guanine nucleotide-binding protein subunit alpha [Borealophlyctis nickersoniae]